jgi:hypothetical protein
MTNRFHHRQNLCLLLLRLLALLGRFQSNQILHHQHPQRSYHQPLVHHRHHQLFELMFQLCC